MQLVPFPVNPGLQEQLNDPTVLLQMACVLQLSVFEAHSSISKKKDDGFHVNHYKLDFKLMLLADNSENQRKSFKLLLLLLKFC